MIGGPGHKGFSLLSNNCHFTWQVPWEAEAPGKCPPLEQLPVCSVVLLRASQKFLYREAGRMAPASGTSRGDEDPRVPFNWRTDDNDEDIVMDI